MAIILDADVIIRGEKGEFDLFGWLSHQSSEHFELAAITVAELWHGVERATGRRRSVREAYLETVTSLLPVIPYTEQTGRIHARLWADLEKRGRLIGEYDIIVAATAMERDGVVATFNQRHFGSVKGLKVILPA